MIISRTVGLSLTFYPRNSTEHYRTLTVALPNFECQNFSRINRFYRALTVMTEIFLKIHSITLSRYRRAAAAEM